MPTDSKVMTMDSNHRGSNDGKKGADGGKPTGGKSSNAYEGGQAGYGNARTGSQGGGPINPPEYGKPVEVDKGSTGKGGQGGQGKGGQAKGGQGGFGRQDWEKPAMGKQEGGAQS